MIANIRLFELVGMITFTPGSNDHAVDLDIHLLGQHDNLRPCSDDEI